MEADYYTRVTSISLEKIDVNAKPMTIGAYGGSTVLKCENGTYLDLFEGKSSDIKKNTLNTQLYSNLINGGYQITDYKKPENNPEVKNCVEPMEFVIGDFIGGNLYTKRTEESVEDYNEFYQIRFDFFNDKSLNDERFENITSENGFSISLEIKGTKASDVEVYATLIDPNGVTYYAKKTESVDDYLKDYMSCYEIFYGGGGKPIIYLYPEQETKINVEMVDNDRLIVSYPQYPQNGWNVLAKPNGDLYDLDTNKNLYALYYENANSINFNGKEDGYVVEGKDITSFLEEKLAILGLSDREKEEFIIYWLPRLFDKEYLYIRFATNDEINENMPMKITPAPDSIIRVWMTFKEVDETYKCKEQKLNPAKERNGFTVVEWGVVEL